ncbi:MAG: glycerol-3-phosphate acyltransferase [Candidatus Heimdallarchaeota archaeon]
MSFAIIWPFFISPIIGFLIGGFPTAYIVCKSVVGIDPREYGSGSVSTRNTIRIAGLWPWGTITFSVDIIKGALAVAIVEYLIAPIVETSSEGFYTQFYVILCAIAAVAGHCWMPYLGFKGGKGLGTCLGLFVYIYWPAAIFWMLAVFIMIRISGFSGIGSCWALIFISPFWYLIDTISASMGLTDLFIAFWPHIYFTDGQLGWPFILLYALGLWLVVTIRHFPEFRKIKRGEAKSWNSLKTSEMLK